MASDKTELPQHRSYTQIANAFTPQSNHNLPKNAKRRFVILPRQNRHNCFFSPETLAPLPENAGVVSDVFELGRPEPYGVLLLAGARPVEADWFLKVPVARALVPHEAESSALRVGVVGPDCSHRTART